MSSEDAILVSGPTQWVNDERTVLVMQWHDGTMTVWLRDAATQLYGPPIIVRPEQ